MAFSTKQRQALINEIVVNNEFSEEALDSLTDNQLVALAEPDKLNELVNNAMPPALAKGLAAKKAGKAAPVEDDEEGMEEDDMEEDDMEEEPAPKKDMTALRRPKMSANQWMAAAPPELRRLVANAQVVEANRRNVLIETITANANCPFDEDQLKTRSLEDLEAFAAMAGGSSGAPNYNYAGASGFVGNSNVEALPMPGADYMKP
jgi:hypothetical protein